MIFENFPEQKMIFTEEDYRKYWSGNICCVCEDEFIKGGNN